MHDATEIVLVLYTVCLRFICIDNFNPIALRTAKTLQSFGCSECNRVKSEKGGKPETGTVASPQSVLIYLHTATHTLIIL